MNKEIHIDLEKLVSDAVGVKMKQIKEKILKEYKSQLREKIEDINLDFNHVPLRHWIRGVEQDRLKQFLIEKLELNE